MNVLMIWPRFPSTFWSFESVLELVGRKALMPPLGLVTVAGLLPRDWPVRLVDRNVSELREEDWDWAEVVMLSAMIVQRDDFLALIEDAKRRGKPVAVGGPFVTSVPQDAEAAGADYLVLDEGEITVPPFLDVLERNGAQSRGHDEPAACFRAEGKKPELAETPVARFDLLDFEAYDAMAVQYSRGCPFLCEFCDIINLYGRRPRTKDPAQLLAELDRLYELGWGGSIFLVDDNFIGNKKNVKRLLKELRHWQRLRDYPFHFDTEASVDLAADSELLALMVDCNFKAVFLGIETPDAESLELTRKHQNNRQPMIDAVRTITRSGIRVMAGFIIGFDNETKGAGDRIVRFVEQSDIPHAFLSMLQVLPNTGLWTRLQREGRLRDEMGTVNQTTALNFVPTRPAAQIAHEFFDAFDALYDPVAYLDRVYRCFPALGTPRLQRAAPKERVPPPPSHRGPASKLSQYRMTLIGLRAMSVVMLRQGVLRSSRLAFWHHLISIAWRRPRNLVQFLEVSAHNEHFLAFRKVIRDSKAHQIASLSTDVYSRVEQAEPVRERRKPAVVSHLAGETPAIAG